jgi:hypothetical protein
MPPFSPHQPRSLDTKMTPLQKVAVPGICVVPEILKLGGPAVQTLK